MIQLLGKGQTSFRTIEVEDLKRDSTPLDDALWIDLHLPTPEEQEIVGKSLSAKIPTMAEMQEIEESSRLFVEGTGLYMSSWLLSEDSANQENTAVTFVLSPHHLTSIRYSDHHAFRVFTNQQTAALQSRRFKDKNDVFVDLMETVVGHTASTLRQVKQSLLTLSTEIFSERIANENGKKRKPGLKKIVQRLGKQNALVSSLRENSVSMQNLAMFAISNSESRIGAAHVERLRLLESDIGSLREYDSQLSSEIGFLLDSTVGLISYEQNQSMKIMSIVALVLALV